MLSAPLASSSSQATDCSFRSRAGRRTGHLPKQLVRSSIASTRIKWATSKPGTSDPHAGRTARRPCSCGGTAPRWRQQALCRPTESAVPVEQGLPRRSRPRRSRRRASRSHAVGEADTLPMWFRARAPPCTRKRRCTRRLGMTWAGSTIGAEGGEGGEVEGAGRGEEAGRMGGIACTDGARDRTLRRFSGGRGGGLYSLLTAHAGAVRNGGTGFRPVRRQSQRRLSSKWEIHSTHRFKLCFSGGRGSRLAPHGLLAGAADGALRAVARRARSTLSSAGLQPLTLLDPAATASGPPASGRARPLPEHLAVLLLLGDGSLHWSGCSAPS